MVYKLRDYQVEASDAAVRFFSVRSKNHAIEVLPTGSGKSLIIADIAHRLEGETIVLQPNREILEQNYRKMCSYGVEDCAIFSASFNKKDIGRITFATIGSVANQMDRFSHFRNVIIDECHWVNPKGGQYIDFIKAADRKVLGLTATPYRLASTSQPVKDERGRVQTDLFGEPVMERGAILRFLTRTNPKVFKDVIYLCQVGDLLRRGYLARLNYYDVTPKCFLQKDIKRNTTGMDFDYDSVEANFKQVNMYSYLVSIVRRLQNAGRRSILVFSHGVSEAYALKSAIVNCECVTGTTPGAERASILRRFKDGELQVVVNVGVLTTGFDYPELETIVLGRPTMSLALYYQMVGRAIRPCEGKNAWIVDLCGNYDRFGRVENLRVEQPSAGMWCVNGFVNGHWKQLTNVFF
ncbi:MAG: DEAD/DEAH box helicase [Prevotella sp.]|nr:DEAD/DEAH box helicase [Prevotella sp.]